MTRDHRPPARDWREQGARTRHLLLRLRPLLREACLFLALTLGLLSLDAVDPSPASLWWPLPLALLCAALAMASSGGPCPHWRHAGWLAVIGGALGLRALLSLYGAIPAVGLREAQNLSVILALGIGLWALAAARPARALMLWTGASALTWLTFALAAQRPPRLDPALWACGFTTLAGLLQLFRLRAPWAALERDPEWARRPLVASHRGALSAGVLALLAGGVLGWWLAGRTPELALMQRVALDQGREALASLWSHSVLLGWGLTTLDRLVTLQGQPRVVLSPPWGGMVGFLASAGLCGLVLLAALVAVVLRRARVAAPRRSAVGMLAMASRGPALLLAGWWVLGGPHSAVFLACLGGWIALALGTPARRPVRLSRPIRWMPSIYAGAACAAGMLLLALPAWGSAGWRGADGGKLPPDIYRMRLVRAQAGNPFDPRIPLAQAASWKSSMQAGAKWSESTYLRVMGLFRRAAELDPYDPLIALRTAQFQAEQHRDQEALETVTRALERMPNAWELQDWAFLTALRLGDRARAFQVLDQGLRSQPERADWWRRRHALAQMQGQTLLAEQALDIALTAAPGDPRLQLASWRAAHGQREAAPNLPPVALPGSEPTAATAP